MPEGLSPLSTKIVEFLRKQQKPRSTNYVATAVDRSATDTERELEALESRGLIELVPDGAPYNGRPYDGWKIAS